ncbi:MAG: aminotransferase DegT [Chloroflexi bacterium]|nr:aminotransferase DegT [Chloroflexota bacterium]
MIPLSVPEIRGNEWKYLKECLDTNWISSAGTYVDKFERLVADYLGIKYAVATNSGTSALHMALKVSGVNENEEVFVSALSFIAPANAIRYIGAWPVFVDAEPDYWQMDPRKILEFIENNCEVRSRNLYNKKSGRKITAVLPVHILGHPCDMDPILDIAQKYNLIVIEDASQSLGTTYKSTPSGTIGHIGCFSFNGNKTVTCGGGGMVVTNNMQWAETIRHVTTQAKSHPVEYVHDQIGYNYRLTNIQAAIGCAQMEQIDEFLEQKRRIARTYEDHLSGSPGINLMKNANWANHSYWLYTILIDSKDYGCTSRDLLEALSSLDIQTRPLWQPLHLSSAHDSHFRYNCPVSEKLSEGALSIPSSVGLDNANQRIVIDAINSISHNL